MNIEARKIKGIIAMIALFVSACSGGGDSTPAPGPDPDPAGPIGGITRTGALIAIGPVTGFGSIIVNGVTYDTSSSTFSDDGQAVTQGDLKVGDMVLVQGSIDDNNTNGVADSVTVEDSVDGPVSSVDAAAGTIIVLGQTVIIGADTSIDDSCPATLDELLNVVAVEVSGQFKSDGSISATRLECKALLGELEVNGLVSALGANTFMVNNLVVDYMSVPAVLDDFANGSINNGDPIEAKGTSLGANGELIATRVEYKGNRFADDEGDHAEIEGFITRYVSETDFDVSGIPVTTVPGSTQYEGGTAADLGLNIKVEVEGEFSSSGVMTATKVEIKQAKSVRITAQVDSVSGNSVVVLGITVNTDVRTRMEDKSDASLEQFRIADVTAGDYIEARGQEIPAGSGEVLATIFERDDLDTEAILQGFVEANGVNRPTLTILGVTIETNGATVYQNDDETIIADPDDFWSQVQEGSLIKAKGTESSAQVIIAEEVELQTE